MKSVTDQKNPNNIVLSLLHSANYQEMGKNASEYTNLQHTD